MCGNVCGGWNSRCRGFTGSGWRQVEIPFASLDDFLEVQEMLVCAMVMCEEEGLLVGYGEGFNGLLDLT